MKLLVNKDSANNRDTNCHATGKKKMSQILPDIKPYTPIRSLNRQISTYDGKYFNVDDVAPVVGMSPTFIRKICGRKKKISATEILSLLDQDSFCETVVPRSMVLSYLVENSETATSETNFPKTFNFTLKNGDALKMIKSLPEKSVRCVVTSTPYWALRLYKDSLSRKWADGSVCPFGHEQTPEEFVRHTCEILLALYKILDDTGSIWWNIMDSFNTRTQIRGSAVEALKAMQGKDKRKWSQHDCRRYSAGHSYLKDGEQCLIPAKIAERASRMGFYVKSMITWAKTSTLPEPQESRVSRNLEYVIHLSKVRAPYFDKAAYRELPAVFGGRNNSWETDKLSDVWTLPTSSGRDGHGAQFPIALPARCIALSTMKDDVVLDPFVGAGNAGVAAIALGRKFIGFDVVEAYLSTAAEKLRLASEKANILPLDKVVTAIEEPDTDVNL